MFIKQFELFKLFGFSIKIDLSWFIIVALITWSLARGLFPQLYPTLELATYWWMGLAGALGLFVSIVLHELAHSLVARRFDMPMRGITLFIFGGVAEMTDEPPTPKAEFLVAIAGPIASVLIAVVCYGVFWLGVQAGWMTAVNGVLGWLALINVILVLFNMVPAFPLDGGRVLRSILWYARGNLRSATWVTSQIGSAFGILLIVGGVVNFMYGNFVGGVWWFILGLFLRGAATMSYQQLLLRQALEGERVERFMVAEVHTVAPQTTIEELVENHVYKYHHKMFPVVEQGELKGCITTRNVREIPREQWSSHTVTELAQPCSGENTITPDADAMQALSRMNRNDLSRLMVVENGHLRGIVSLKDLMKFMSLKVEMEEEG